MNDPLTNRFRESFDDSGISHGPTVVYNYPSGSVRSTIPRDWSVLTYEGQSYWHSNQTWDVDNPGYWAARRRGQIVNNEYKNEKRYCFQNVFTPKFTRITWDANNELTGDYISVYNDLPSETVASLAVPHNVNINIDYLIDKAVTQLHARLFAAPMQALVTLGELKQTIGLCRSLLSKTGDMLRFAKKSATSNAFRNKSRDTIIRMLDRGPTIAGTNKAVNRMSRQWLEYRYGIRQLYYDYSSAAKAMRSMNAKPRQRYTASESDSKSYSESAITNNWTGMKTHTKHTKTSRFIVASAGAIVEARKQEVGFVQAFGLDEVFQAAWDLTRFSFIVDWFINVGDKIAALAPKGDIDVVASWVKVVDTVNHSGYTTFTPTERNGNELLICEDWDPHVQYRSITTTRLKNPTINPIPNWDIRLSVGKVVDLLAILKTLPILR